MPHVWYHCGGAGEKNGVRNVDLPYYDGGGISTYAWEPPHDMPQAKVVRYDKQMAKKHHELLKIMAKATGKPINDDGVAHVIEPPAT